jgi:hypothetical protein
MYLFYISSFMHFICTICEVLIFIQVSKMNIPAKGPAYRLMRLLKRSKATKTIIPVNIATPMTIPAICPPLRPPFDEEASEVPSMSYCRQILLII